MKELSGFTNTQLCKCNIIQNEMHALFLVYYLRQITYCIRRKYKAG